MSMMAQTGTETALPSPKHLDAFTGGWLVGDFVPALLKSSEVEVAIKRYQAGDREAAHVHKQGREWTVVVTGRIQMNGRIYGAGEIVEVPPGTPASFASLSEATTLVLKSPSVPGDKFVLSTDVLS
jgi:mannose-6-phosphate isomerase-like protein (cupin superfamily)